MTEFTAKVRENGQITIPHETCIIENIKQGTFVRFQILAVVGESK